MSRPSLDLTCPACEGDGRPHALVKHDAYRLVRCTRCRTQYFRPDPSLPGAAAAGSGASEYWEDYKFEVYESSEVRAGYEQRYREVLELARPWVPAPTSLLDVGCGIGNFLDFASRAGLRATGTDVEERAVAGARGRGLDAHLPAELSSALDDGAVDLLTLWDVVEHVMDPAALLREGLRKVRPGGALLLETPDGGFPVRSGLLSAYRLSRGRVDLTSPMYYWEHKVYFTEAGLRALLVRVGVRPVAVQRAPTVRAKMQEQFAQDARTGSLLSRGLRTAWPALESGARRVGVGNKLLAVGVVGPAAPVGA